MSMWYDFAGVLILNDSVCATSTLIEVAKPWIVGLPAPLTCQSLGGSPGSVFSQAMTLVTGGPHGPAAVGRALASNSKPKTTASIAPMTERCFRTRRAGNPLTDMLAPGRDTAIRPPGGGPPLYARCRAADIQPGKG